MCCRSGGRLLCRICGGPDEAARGSEEIPRLHRDGFGNVPHNGRGRPMLAPAPDRSRRFLSRLLLMPGLLLGDVGELAMRVPMSGRSGHRSGFC